jgi:RNA recognition motif-containing protein
MQAGQEAPPVTTKIFVGNLPTNITETELLHHLNTALSAAGLSTSVGPPLLAAHIDDSRRFALVKARSVEEASNLLVFDDLECHGSALTLRRPTNFLAEEV